MMVVNPINGYSLKIGIVVDIDPEANTVDVRVVKRFNHRIYSVSGTVIGESFDEYEDDILTNVGIKLTTDDGYYATGDKNAGAFSMFLQNFNPDTVDDPIYCYILFQDEGSEHFITGCFLRSEYREEDVTALISQGFSRLSQRLFPTHKQYLVITGYQAVPHIKNHYIWDLETNSLITTMTDTEWDEIPVYDFAQVSGSVSASDKFKELYGESYDRTVVDTTSEYTETLTSSTEGDLFTLGKLWTPVVDGYYDVTFLGIGTLHMPETLGTYDILHVGAGHLERFGYFVSSYFVSYDNPDYSREYYGCVIYTRKLKSSSTMERNIDLEAFCDGIMSTTDLSNGFVLSLAILWKRSGVKGLQFNEAYNIPDGHI